MNFPERILVTGGAGYIGSHTTKALLEKTESVITIIDNLSTGFIESIETLKRIAEKHGRKLNFIKADIADSKTMASLLQEGIDAILHFAASIAVAESFEKPIEYYSNNTINTMKLIELAERFGVGRFILSSSAAVYGKPSRIPVREKDHCNPINPYGFSKLAAERILQDVARAHGHFKYMILRYFNAAGADPQLQLGQRNKEATHLIKIAAQTATGKRKCMYIFGNDYPTPDGTCIRDYIHVNDLADVHVKALEYLQNNPSDIFNIGYGRGYSVKEVINTMKRVSGVDFEVKVAPRRKGDPPVLVADISKISTRMAFKPQYNSLEYICKTAYLWEKKMDV